jgi:hypothetical protein
MAKENDHRFEFDIEPLRGFHSLCINPFTFPLESYLGETGTPSSGDTRKHYGKVLPPFTV